ncbi:helix-turn-helix domain-containing protein [Paludisphaera mucosa]|uniref:Helix-turn-helix domain-containing protein n=1 Tax=Paludisphaera mucosa TaxID=3030827 RepID=A0ABT6FLV1_9BACT|nr:helix-turn-helix domain-containing protein [Paludisphaera mucosa]MDG3008350.1 helix-turn-helix domain-containing protein [Paludisphaera mucosa]MDG3008421.1 helix-turn-helix domain-containing protein [Paludisphaera mucosa]
MTIKKGSRAKVPKRHEAAGLPASSGGMAKAKRMKPTASLTPPFHLRNYLALVKKFPLQPIRDDAHLGEALATVETLMCRDLDEGAESYLAVLTGLVEAYEAGTRPIPDASEADVLGLLMEQKGVSQTDLRDEVGISQSTVSAVLRGARNLTKSQVVDLARFFKVPPAVFLPRT